MTTPSFAALVGRGIRPASARRLLARASHEAQRQFFITVHQELSAKPARISWEDAFTSRHKSFK